MLILDTETTGMGSNDEVIEIAIINEYGEVLLNQRIKPTINISSQAQDIHSISDDDVSDCPRFIDVYPKLLTFSANNIICCYKTVFDIRLINQSLKKYWRNTVFYPKKNICVMQWVNHYFNLDKTKHLPLKKACQMLEIDFDDNSAHHGIYDCQKTLEIINKLKNKSKYYAR